MIQRSLLLTRLLIQGGDFSFGGGSIVKKRKALSSRTSLLASTAGKIVMYLLLLAYISVVSFIMGRSTTRAALQLGVADQLPMTIVPMLCMVSVLFGFVFVVTAFYHTNNSETLLAMPFRPAEIIAARYLQVVSYLYISVCAFFVPFFVAFGIYSKQTPLFYPAMLIFMAVIPFLALALVTILIMLLMRFTKFFKNKDRFTVFSTIVILLASVGLSTALNMQVNSTGANMGIQLPTSLHSALGKVNWLFFGADFGARWLSQSATLQGWLYGLLFILASLLWMALLLFVAQKVYFKGVMSISNSNTKGQKLTRKERAALAVTHGPFRSFWQKEIRVLMRTPAFFSNNVLLCFLMPLIIMLPLYFSLQAAGVKLADAKQLARIYFSLPGALDEAGPFILMVVMGVALFLSGSNGIAAGAISREGAGAYLMKLYPYPFMKQLMIKLAVGLAFSLFTPFILIAVVQSFLVLPLGLLLPICLLCLLSVLLVNLLGLWADLLMPKLNWANEQQAAKQNWNVLIEMFGGMLLAGLGILLMYLVNKYITGYLPVLGVATLFLLLACALLFVLIKLSLPRALRLLAE